MSCRGAFLKTCLEMIVFLSMDFLFHLLRSFVSRRVNVNPAASGTSCPRLFLSYGVLQASASERLVSRYSERTPESIVHTTVRSAHSNRGDSLWKRSQTPHGEPLIFVLLFSSFVTLLCGFNQVRPFLNGVFMSTQSIIHNNIISHTETPSLPVAGEPLNRRFRLMCNKP